MSKASLKDALDALYGESPYRDEQQFKCRFCGDLHVPTELDVYGHCQACVRGMARNND